MRRGQAIYSAEGIHSQKVKTVIFYSIFVTAFGKIVNENLSERLAFFKIMLYDDSREQGCVVRALSILS